MPATNYTPIQLYRSTTSGNLPLAANLSPGEIALNIADNDMTMYFENASGVVKRFFNNPAELKYPTADGTSGQFLTTNGSGVLSFGSVSAGALTNNTRQAVTSSATTTINLNSGNVIDLTMAANITTLSFTNVPASGTPILIQIIVKNASSGVAYTITWPNSVYWSGQYAATTLSTVQTAPTLATGANGVTVIALLTTDGGTKFRGWVEATIIGGVAASLYTWGSNSEGRLGLNTTDNSSSPIQVGALTTWANVSAGDSFCTAVRTDGTLWSWGNNTAGRLGLNDTNPRSSPVQVGSSTDWSSSSSGNASTIAVKNTGTLWSWGNGSFGRLGQNSTTYLSQPVQIGTLNDWKSVSATLGAQCIAVKTDGTLWSWGLGTSGRLGQNTVDNISSPTQVGLLTNWASASAGNDGCVAVKTNGTLWAWGRNQYGQLGQNDKTSFSSPVQIGSLDTWASASEGAAFCAAIKTDGTLWSWGYGYNGQLGLGSAPVYRSSPVQVGSSSNWSQIRTGDNFCLAITTSGSLWSWGRGSTGRLGQGFNYDGNSPGQVGAQTDWLQAAPGLGGFGAGRRGFVVNPA